MKKYLFTILVGISLTLSVMAQGPRQDPLQRFFFPPELVMRNQKALNITEDQRAYFIEQVQEAQSEFMEARWDLQSEMEKLRSLLGDSETDESVLLDQLDAVLDQERVIKRTQVLLSYRIWKTLDPEQRNLLRELRRQEQPRNGGRRGPGVDQPPQQE